MPARLERQPNSLLGTGHLDVNEIVFLFNRAIKSILSNYIPH